MSNPIHSDHYSDLLQSIRQLLHGARQQAVQTVNTLLAANLLTYRPAHRRI